MAALSFRCLTYTHCQVAARPEEASNAGRYRTNFPATLVACTIAKTRYRVVFRVLTSAGSSCVIAEIRFSHDV